MQNLLAKLKQHKKLVILALVSFLIVLILIGALVISFAYSAFNRPKSNVVSDTVDPLSNVVKDPQPILTSYAVSYPFVGADYASSIDSLYVLSGEIFSVQANGAVMHINVIDEPVVKANKSSDGKKIVFTTLSANTKDKRNATKLYQYDFASKKLDLIIDSGTPVVSYPSEPNGISFTENIIGDAVYCNDDILFNVDRNLYRQKVSDLNTSAELVDAKDAGNYLDIKCSDDGKTVLTKHNFHEGYRNFLYSYSDGKYLKLLAGEEFFSGCCGSTESKLAYLSGNDIYVSNTKVNSESGYSFTISKLGSDTRLTKIYEAQGSNSIEFFVGEGIVYKYNSLTEKLEAINLKVSPVKVTAQIDTSTFTEDVKLFSFLQEGWCDPDCSLFLGTSNIKSKAVKAYRVENSLEQLINYVDFLKHQTSELYQETNALLYAEYSTTPKSDLFIVTFDLNSRTENWLYNKTNNSWTKLISNKNP